MQRRNLRGICARRVGLVMAALAGSITVFVAAPVVVEPTPAAASSSAPVAYVAVNSANLMRPVNTTTGTVGAAIAVGAEPVGAAVAPDGKTVYVANSLGGSMTPITTATSVPGTAVRVGGGPQGVAITPNGKTAYLPNYPNNTVIPVTVATNTAGAPIAVGQNPIGVAITPDGSTAYATNLGDNTVTPIATATNTPGTPIAVGVEPDGVAITPDGTTLFVTNFSDGTVTPIATATNTPGTPIAVGNEPSAVAITPDGATAYVSNQLDGTVTPIATATDTPGTPIAVGSAPDAVAITPDGATAYVTNSGSGNVTPIHTATNTAGSPITVGPAPEGIAITPDQAPVAVLSVVPAAAGSGTATQFSAAGSLAPSSAIVSYAWDFGDGATAITSVPTTSHDYTSANTYTASVTETDADGTSTTKVFTGQTVSRDGGSSAKASAHVVIVSCTVTHTCKAAVSAPSSATTPPQSMVVTGKPTAARGTVTLSLSPASLVCPTVDTSVAPVANLADTGFATTTRLTVTTTLHNSIRAGDHFVCFNSKTPFRSESSPTVKKAGSGLLLGCSAVANAPPCVTSAKQSGANVVVSFVVPGGDPRFRIATYSTTRIRQPVVPAGRVGRTYTGKLTTLGGVAPTTWKLVSGKLPKGLTLNAKTGAITGKPSAKGSYTCVLRAADAEKPPETARTGLTITVK